MAQAAIPGYTVNGFAIKANTLGGLLDLQVASHGERDFIRICRLKDGAGRSSVGGDDIGREGSDSAGKCTDLTISVAQFARSTARMCMTLRGLGIHKGSVVAVLSRNSYAYAELAFALASIGAVTAPVNTNVSADNLHHIASTSRATFCAASADRVTDARELRRRMPQMGLLLLDDPPQLSHRTASWDDEQNSAGNDRQNGNVDGETDLTPHVGSGLWTPDQPLSVEDRSNSTNETPVTSKDLCFILHTSGTRSAPKLVPLTHENILYNRECALRAWADLYFTESGVAGQSPSVATSAPYATLGWMPFFHVIGLAFELTGNLYNGGCYWFAPFVTREARNPRRSSPPSARDFIAAVKHTRADILYCVPWMLEQVRDVISIGGCEAEDAIKALQSARFIMSGGVRLRDDLGDFFSQNGVTVVEGLGMTDTAGALLLGNPRVGDWRAVTPIPGLNAEFVGDDGSILRQEEWEKPLESVDLTPRELVLVDCPSVLSGYLDNPEATMSAFPSPGRFHTRDLFERVGPASFRYIGRRDDTFCHTSGEKTNPLPIEAHIERAAIVNRAALYGDQRPFNVAIVELAETTPQMSAVDIQLLVWEAVDSASALQPAHSRVSRDAVVIVRGRDNRVDGDTASARGKAHVFPLKPIPVTAKGSIARAAVASEFVAELDDIYRRASAQLEQIALPATALALHTDKVGPPKAAALDVGAIRAAIADTVRPGVAFADLDADETFSDMGLSSVRMVQCRRQIESRLGLDEGSLPNTLLFDHATPRDLLAHLCSLFPNPAVIGGGATSGQPSDLADTEAGGARSSREEDPCIVGMACRLPGAASPEQLWRMLCEGLDPITRVPKGRWDSVRLHDPDMDAPGRLYTDAGGFLDRVDAFDAAVFGIGASEAREMDPQHRILLEVAWEALEDAGMCGASLAKGRYGIGGVFVGVTNTDYHTRQLRAGRPLSDVGPYYGTGNAACALAGRVAYHMNLRGPALTVDTACSSSAVAIHLACAAIARGECDFAVAGGVNLILAPDASLHCSRAHMLSPSGRCRTFDSSADGYVRSEGCGMVVIRRRRDAERGSQDVACVVAGTAVNQDGRSNGLTAPYGPSQVACIQRALSASCLKPNDVAYVEAHGTGTQVGDEVEGRSLRTVFGKSHPPRDRPLVVGALKSHIGHAESAAGVAGVIKTAMCLEWQMVPPNLHYEQPSDGVRLDAIPALIPSRVARELVAPAGRSVLTAGVCAYGATGTNAHIVLTRESRDDVVASDAAVSSSAGERPAHVIALSAHTRGSLIGLASRLVPFFRGGGETKRRPRSLADECHTINCGRRHFPIHRLGVCAADRESMAQRIDEAVAQLTADTNTESHSDAHEAHNKKTVFLFAGQGTQRAGMGRELYTSERAFKQAYDNCDRTIRRLAGFSVVSLLYGDGEDAKAPSAGSALHAHVTLFCLQHALVAMWDSWGIRPTHVIGHSFGEYAAACAAGVFTLEDALFLVVRRGELMDSIDATDGRMTAVFAAEEDVTRCLHSCYDGVSVAAVNGPKCTVLSGPSAVIARWLEDNAAPQGWTYRDLSSMALAFHSAAVDPILDELQSAVSKVTALPPRIPIACTLSGKLSVAAADVTDHVPPITHPLYWRRHARERVRFADGIRSILQSGAGHVGASEGVFIELGSDSTLLGLTKRCINAPLRASHFAFLPSLGTSGTCGADTAALTSLAALYQRGYDVDWDSFDSSRNRRIVRGVPTYSFALTRFWYDSNDDINAPAGAASRDSCTVDFSLTNKHAAPDAPDVVTTRPYNTGDHVVLGRAVVPAAGHVVMAVAALSRSSVFTCAEDEGKGSLCFLENVLFSRPLEATLDASSPSGCHTARIHFSKVSDSVWSIMSLGVGGRLTADKSVHMEGRVRPTSSSVASGLANLIVECAKSEADSALSESRPCHGDEFYKYAASTGLSLAQSFTLLRDAVRFNCGSISGKTHRYSRGCICSVSLDVHTMGNDVNRFMRLLTPGFVDSVFQGAFFTFIGQEYESLYLPVAAEAVYVFRAGDVPHKSTVTCFILRHRSDGTDIVVDVVATVDGLPLFAAHSLRFRRVAREIFMSYFEAGGSDSDRSHTMLIHTPELSAVSPRLHAIRWLATPMTSPLPGGRTGLTRWAVVSRDGTVPPELPLGNLSRDDETCAFVCGSADAQLSHALDSCISNGVVSVLCVIYDAGESLLPNVQALVEVFRMLALRGDRARVLCACLSAGGGSELIGPVAYAAFLRCAAMELPSLRWSVVACDTASIRQAVADEMHYLVSVPAHEIDPSGEVRYVDGIRYTPCLQYIASNAPSETSRHIRSDLSYIVTGGFGAVGLTVLEWLVDRGCRWVALVGRTGASSRESRAALASCRLRGAAVLELTADVASAGFATTLSAAMTSSAFPPCDGVFHLAGVLRDASVLTATAEVVRDVLSPKLNGAVNTALAVLEEAGGGGTAGNTPFFVFFSSVASLLGAPGQSVYAAANGALDGYAEALRSRGVPALSLNWGPLAVGGGMYADAAGASSADAFSRLVASFPVLSAQDARTLLDSAVHSLSGHNAPSRAGAFAVDWRAYAAHLRRLHRCVPLMLAEVHTVDQAPDDATTTRFGRAVSVADVGATVVDVIRSVLGLAPDVPVNESRALTAYGMDSLGALEIRNELSRRTLLTLPGALLFDCPTARDLTLRLHADLLATTAKAKAVGGAASVARANASVADQAEETKSASASAGVGGKAKSPPVSAAAHSADGDEEGVVIAGMACRFPGGIATPDAFWSALCNKKDCVATIPTDRFDAASLVSRGLLACNAGGFLGDVRKFDAEFFGIPAAEADSMDPQQRLLLEVAWEAIGDAGIAPSSIAGSRTGVFVGLSSQDYAGLQMKSGVDVTATYASGYAASVASGRLAYCLNLKGPTLTVDTACSSSLVAVHLACEAIRCGECDTAIAGGVNLILSHELSVAFSKSKMLSPSGRCRTFDASADGYVRAEGCGIVFLRRASSSSSTSVGGGRTICRVLGSALTHDGRSNGLTAPNGPAQASCIRGALARAGVAPSHVGFVEAHGTGTQLGDAVELGALADVFGAVHRETPLLLGSVKTNIGHAEAAAGIAALIKGALCVQRGFVPPAAHYTQPNPHVDLSAVPAAVNTAGVEWIARADDRIAGISSFGFSGTNCHVILAGASQYVPTDVSIGTAGADNVYVVSAANAESLEPQLARHLDYLAAIAEHSDGESAYARACSLSVLGRDHLPHRVSVVASSAAAARTGLMGIPRDMLSLSLGHVGVHQWSGGATCMGHVGAGRPTAAIVFGDCTSDVTLMTPLDIIASECPSLDANSIRASTGAMQTATLIAAYRELYALAPRMDEDDSWDAWHVASIGVYGALAVLCVCGAITMERALAAAACMHETHASAAHATMAETHTVKQAQMRSVARLWAAPDAPLARSFVASSGRLYSRDAIIARSLEELLCDTSEAHVPIRVGLSIVIGEGAHPHVAAGVVHYYHPSRGDRHAALRAVLFAAGVDVNPSARSLALHKWAMQSLTPLPTYAFQGTPHWFDSLNTSTAPSAAVSLVSHKPLSSLHEDEQAAISDAQHRISLTSVTAIVASAVRRLLGLPPTREMDPNRRLMELGVDSLVAVDLREAVCAALGVTLAPAAVYEHPTIALLSLAALQAVDDRAHVHTTQLTHASTIRAQRAVTHDEANRHAPFPLTPIQRAYWVGSSDAMPLGGVSCHIYMEFEIGDGTIPGAGCAENALDKLETAWAQLVRRHDMLRVVVSPDGMQRVLCADALLSHVQFRRRTIDGPLRSRDWASDEWRVSMAHRMYDPAVWPPFDIRATASSEGGHVRLHAGFSMIAVDLWSLAILFSEWKQLAEDSTRIDRLTPPTQVSFRDYVVCTARDGQAPVSLAVPKPIPPPPSLPLLRPIDHEMNSNLRFSHVDHEIPAAVWSQVASLAAANGVTKAMTLFAVYCDLLARWSENKEFALTVSVFNRPDSAHRDIRRIVGDFTTAVLVDLDLSGENTDALSTPAVSTQSPQSPQLVQSARTQPIPAPFRTVAHTVQQAFVTASNAAMDGQQRPRQTAPATGDGVGIELHPYVFTAFFAPQSMEYDMPDSWIAPLVYRSSETPQVLLDCQVHESRSGGLVVSWDYAIDLFPAGLVADMFSSFVGCIHRLAMHDTWSTWLDVLPASQAASIARVNATAYAVDPMEPRKAPVAPPFLQPDSAGNVSGSQPTDPISENVPLILQPRSRTLLHDPFVEKALETSGALALVCGTTGRRMSYAQLLRAALDCADSIQACLIADGIDTASGGSVSGHHVGEAKQPVELVAVLMWKGWEQVVAVIAILLSGRAYVPIDPTTPPARIEKIVNACLSHTASRLTVLTQARVASEQPAALACFGRVVVVGAVGASSSFTQSSASEDSIDIRRRLVSLEREMMSHRLADDDRAYVIFTSGSTGEPKGVAVSHRSALNTLLDVNATHGVTARDCALALSELTFDLSVYDIFGVLAAGGSIVLPPSTSKRNPEVWAQLCSSESVTLWNSVPAYLDMLVEYISGVAVCHAAGRVDARAILPPLRVIMMSGDFVPTSLITKARALFEKEWGGQAMLPRIVTMGGATEAAVWSVFNILGEVSDGTPLPYGLPMARQACVVVDELLRPTPQHVRGELLIGGAGVALEYVGDPQKTSERFLCGIPGSPGRWYRTGDVCSWNGDGLLEIHGRKDHQVKIGGFRIETGEVEIALSAHPGVQRSVVKALRPNGSSTGALALTAFCIPRDMSSPPSPSDIRAHVRGLLPQHMVPSVVHTLDAFPLSANGKVDHAALERLVARTAPVRVDDARDAATASVASAGGIDTFSASILRVVYDTLGLAYDESEAAGLLCRSLFEVGGDSVTAVRIASRLSGLLGTRVPLRLVMASDSLGHMVSDLKGVAASAALIGASALPSAGTPTNPEASQSPLPLPSHALQPLPLGTYALTPGQRAYWDAEARGDYGARGSMPFSVRIRDASVDTLALQRALGRLVSRHEALRTVFPPQSANGCEPHAIALPTTAYQPRLRVVKCGKGGWPGALAEAIDKEIGAPLEMYPVPPLRVTLFRGYAEGAVLVFNVHHIICDGWSVHHTIHPELARFYAEESGCVHNAVDAVASGAMPTPFSVFASAQHALLGDTAAMQRLWSFWRDELSDGHIPRVCFGAPADAEASSDADSPIVDLVVSTDCEERARIRVLSAAVHATHGSFLPVLLLSYFVTLCRMRVGDTSRDLAVGVVASTERSKPENHGIVGYLTNVVCVRSPLPSLVARATLDTRGGSRVPVIAAVEEMAARWARCVEHADAPFESLVSSLSRALIGEDQEGAALPRPVVQASFGFIDMSNSSEVADVCVLGRPEHRGSDPCFDIALTVCDRGAAVGMEFRWQAEASAVSVSTLRRVAEECETVLRELVDGFEFTA